MKFRTLIMYVVLFLVVLVMVSQGSVEGYAPKRKTLKRALKREVRPPGLPERPPFNSSRAFRYRDDRRLYVLRIIIPALRSAGLRWIQVADETRPNADPYGYEFRGPRWQFTWNAVNWDTVRNDTRVRMLFEWITEATGGNMNTPYQATGPTQPEPWLMEYLMPNPHEAWGAGNSPLGQQPFGFYQTLQNEYWDMIILEFFIELYDAINPELREADARAYGYPPGGSGSGSGGSGASGSGSGGGGLAGAMASLSFVSGRQLLSKTKKGFELIPIPPAFVQVLTKSTTRPTLAKQTKYTATYANLTIRSTGSNGKGLMFKSTRTIKKALRKQVHASIPSMCARAKALGILLDTSWCPNTQALGAVPECPAGYTAVLKPPSTVFRCVKRDVIDGPK